ncbi:MAG TPA: AraC family transcriptional regulator [Diaminobutyricibacter sp.]
MKTTVGQPLSKGLLTPEPADSPVRIDRYWAGPRAATLVRHYWVPRWSLPDGVQIRQDVLEYPTTNIVVEADEARLYRAHRGRGARTLAGTGWAFGVMLQPGTARMLLGASIRSFPASAELSTLGLTGTDPLTAELRLLLPSGADLTAVDLFEHWLLERVPEPDDDAALVNRIVSAVEGDRDLLRVEQVAERFGIGIRRLQRLVGSHIGFSPKWLIQRSRLQEAAAALRSENPPALADLAAALGYADQAHFSREFKTVVGSTPGAYATAARPGAPDTPEAV